MERRETRDATEGGVRITAAFGLFREPTVPPGDIP